MSIFSKTCEYAMRAVFYIARRSHEGQRSGIKEIAEQINSPEAFLAKILQKLGGAGVIQSVKGPNGGFFIADEGLKKPIADIVSAIDGDHIFTGCAMGLHYCSEVRPCPLHHDFKKIRNSISIMLHSTTIGQFNMELLSGHFSLNK